MKFTYNFYLSDEQVEKLKKIQQGMTNSLVKMGFLSEPEAKRLSSLEETFKSTMILGEKLRVDEALDQMLSLYADFIEETEV